MAKKSGKRKDAEQKLAATVEKLQARIKKTEASTDKWKSEAKRLEAELSKRAKQIKKLRESPPPRDDAPAESAAATEVPDESWTVLRLRAAASEAGVVGYSRMSKAALLEALNSAG